jgi:hypothetical protein
VRAFPWLTFVLVCGAALSGCVAPEPMLGTTDVTDKPQQTESPERMTIVANTAGRTLDGGATMDVVEAANGEPTLLIWVAAGCNGCHDWTQALRTMRANGTFDANLSVVSVHRYPSFEDPEDVVARYGTVNSSTEATWPLLLPDEDAVAVDAATGQPSTTSLVEAFGNPVTPTLQVLDGEGRLVWESRTYWANASVLNEVEGLMHGLLEVDA